MNNHYKSALEIAGRIHQGELTSVEVTEELLRRIEKVDSRLKSFVTVTGEQALFAAEKADKELSNGNVRSPLHGVPVAVKDLLDTAGIKTTYGMKIYDDHIPEKDSTVVRKLKSAGCIILGKLKLTEGAYARHHPDVEVPVNPWHEDCWTGVSSSGSGVATAAGLCFASIGSDTGGSIRFPSAVNGLVGIKPTWGRVSRSGAFPLAYTLDHMGPMTRSVRDGAAMLGVIAGRDEDDPTSSHLSVDDYLAAASGGIEGFTVGIDWDYCGNDVETEVYDGIKDAVGLLKELGATIKDVQVPYADITKGWPVTCSVEAAHAHRDTYPSRKEEYGAIADLIELGLNIPAAAYMAHELVRKSFKVNLAGIFKEVDLLVCPSMTSVAPARETSDGSRGEQDLAVTLKFTAPYDFSGSPTLSLPWGIGSKGVPLSIQLVARDFSESMLIKTGYTLEQAGGHFRHHPETYS